MHSAASEQETSGWLLNDVLKELELLLQAVLSHQSEPVLIANNERCCVDASSGAARLLGLSMDKIIGQRMLDLTEPQKLSYTAQHEVLPGRHVFVFDENSREKHTAADHKDYAFFCLDAEGLVVAWYAGAERLYGYTSDEIVGRLVSCLYLDSDDDELRVDFRDELKKTTAEGHSGG